MYVLGLVLHEAVHPAFFAEYRLQNWPDVEMFSPVARDRVFDSYTAGLITACVGAPADALALLKECGPEHLYAQIAAACIDTGVSFDAVHRRQEYLDAIFSSVMGRLDNYIQSFGDDLSPSIRLFVERDVLQPVHMQRLGIEVKMREPDFMGVWVGVSAISDRHLVFDAWLYFCLVREEGGPAFVLSKLLAAAGIDLA